MLNEIKSIQDEVDSTLTVAFNPIMTLGEIMVSEERAQSEPTLAIFGQEDFSTHLFPNEQVMSREQLILFQKELKGLLDEIWETYEEKGALYDQQTPVWHHFPFGLVSYATQVYIKATRFVSLLQMSMKRDEGVPLKEVERTLKALMIYSWYAWTYARLFSEGLTKGAE